MNQIQANKSRGPGRLRRRYSSKTRVDSTVSFSQTSRMHLLQKRSIDGQSTYANSGCCKDGIGQRRCDELRAQFSDTGGRFQTVHNVNLNFRRIIDAQHLIVMKIALFDTPVFDRDLTRKYSGESEIDATLGHGAHAIRVDSQTAINRARKSKHMNRTVVIDGDLGDLCIASIASQTCNTPPMAGWQRLSPSGGLGHNLQHV